MKTAFVTGSTGFVGLNLVEALAAGGWRVRALHRASSDLSILSRFAAERVEGDVTRADSLRAAIHPGTDVVFHVAGDVNMWSRRNERQTLVNVVGTRNVVEAALERGVGRLVHTSSIAAYGLHDGAVDETTPSNAARSWIHYQRTKAVAEEEVRRGIARGLDAVILNPANIIGPYDLGNWSTLLYLVHNGRLPGVPPGRSSFCHVREVVRAHIAAVERGRTGENYLLGGADAEFREVIRLCGEITGRKVRTEPTPAWMLRLVARLYAVRGALTGRPPRLTPEMAHLVCREMTCRSAKAERELGYRPAPLREMFEDCYRWMVREGRVT